MIKYLLFLLPVTIFSQVGINTTTPTTTLHVNGDLRVENIPLKSNKYVLLSDEEGNVTKVLLSSILGGVTNDCPVFIKEGSSSYYIKFKASGYVTNPNAPITVNGLTFNSAGTYIENNIHYYTYTNVSGQPLNINNFSVNFGEHTCYYQN